MKTSKRILRSSHRYLNGRTFTWPLLVLAVCFCASISWGCPPFDKPGDPSDLVLLDDEDNTALDPAFVSFDRVPTPSVKKSVIGKQNSKNVDDKAIQDWSPDAKRLTEQLESAKTPEQTRAVAMEAWSSLAVSVDFQRHALARAQAQSKSTQESTVFTSMLAALNDFDGEVERCRTLARGNELMKKKAADILAQMLKNPYLQKRLTSAP